MKAEKKEDFLGIIWTKKTFTQETQIDADSLGIKYYPRENIKTEWCKKTYALLGTLFVGTAIGTAYYFDWFKKK